MKEKLLQFYKGNAGKCNGVIVGLVIGILLLTLGFWGTLLLALCVGIGLWLGGRKDRGQPIGQLLLHARNWLVGGRHRQ